MQKSKQTTKIIETISFQGRNNKRTTIKPDWKEIEYFLWWWKVGNSAKSRGPIGKRVGPRRVSLEIKFRSESHRTCGRALDVCVCGLSREHGSVRLGGVKLRDSAGCARYLTIRGHSAGCAPRRSDESATRRVRKNARRQQPLGWLSQPSRASLRLPFCVAASSAMVSSLLTAPHVVTFFADPLFTSPNLTGCIVYFSIFVHCLQKSECKQKMKT